MIDRTSNRSRDWDMQKRQCRDRWPGDRVFTRRGVGGYDPSVGGYVVPHFFSRVPRGGANLKAYKNRKNIGT